MVTVGKRRAGRAAIVLVTLLTAAACSSGAGPRDATSSTTTSTTEATTTTAAPAPCTTFGGLDASVGRARPVDQSVSLLSNVQVQASDCVDEVAFDFAGGTPGWTVTYVDPPFTLDPSDLPAEVPGKAFLRVTLRPASGVDLSSPEPRQIYDGPTAMTPPAPSEVESVVRLGDFEAVSTWVIGLPEARPFEITQREEQIVVRIAAPAARSVRCDLAGSPLTVGLPAGWYAELSDRWACQYLHPAPFIIHPGTNDFRWLVTAYVADVNAAEVVARMRASGDERITTTATTVGRRPATRLDVTASGEGMLPAGWRYRMYVVDTGARATVFLGESAGPGPRVEANAGALDSVVALAAPR
jgi:hypothetical protein